MSIKSMLKRLSRAPQADEQAKPDYLAALAPTKGAPGTRVHHEYFLTDAPEGRVNWLARVYAQNGAVNEQRGNEPNEQAAKDAALAWCAEITTALKGA